MTITYPGLKRQTILTLLDDFVNEPIPPCASKFAVEDLEKEMWQAARALEFEEAANLRDEIAPLKKLLSAGA